MWINKNVGGAILAPHRSPGAFDSEAWNAMQWNGMKWNEESFAPWTIKSFFTHYSIICVDRRRDEPGLRLLLPSRGEYLECFVRCVDPKEIDFRSRNVRGNAGNRNRNGPGKPCRASPFPIVRSNSLPLFFTDEGTLATDTNWFQWNFS